MQEELKAERDAFEEWANEQGNPATMTPMGDYYNNEKTFAWKAWQARVKAEADPQGVSGWFIPLDSMSQLAQKSFAEMMQLICHGGAVDVVAQIDGKDFRWECDGLKYAKLRQPQSQGVDEEQARLALRHALAMCHTAHPSHLADVALDVVRPYLRQPQPQVSAKMLETLTGSNPKMNGVAALFAADEQHLSVQKGERHTEFVKRIARAYNERALSALTQQPEEA